MTAASISPTADGRRTKREDSRNPRPRILRNMPYLSTLTALLAAALHAAHDVQVYRIQRELRQDAGEDGRYAEQRVKQPVASSGQQTRERWLPAAPPTRASPPG
jgi:hypothetical protein